MRPSRFARVLLLAVAGVLPGTLALTSAPVAAVEAEPPPAQVTGPLAAAAGPVDVAREVEPVVIEGAKLNQWASPAADGVAAPYPSGSQVPGQSGRPLRTAHNGVITVPPNAGSGVPVDEIAAYRWDGSAWVEVPVQVDERFPHFLANGRSSFSTYSGTDYELTYAWGPSAHSQGEEAWRKVAGGCDGARYPTLAEAQADVASPNGILTLAQGETAVDLTRPKVDPVQGLDADDEVVVMASDAGVQAPAGQAGPDGTLPGLQRQQVAIADPLNPGEGGFIYLFRKTGGSSFQPGQPGAYVDFQRNADADEWIDRYSFTRGDPEVLGVSNTGYGPNIPGPVCRTVADPTDNPAARATPDGQPRQSGDRFPRDGHVVETETYRHVASGRWMIRGLQIDDPAAGTSYGEDLIDRFKGRAFQQSPDSSISLVGFEDEQVNWEANAALLGWRVGPVRALREVWGADSGTNVTKLETYYRDVANFRYRVRVHPIPNDGLYTSWDYNRNVAERYYNVVQDDGVPVDGVNDDQGNVDEVPGGPPAFFDTCDPTFDVCTALGRWEQVSGKDDNGSLVYAFDFIGPTTLANFAVLPYYRDDACLDDGTGDDPVARPWPGEASNDPRVIAGYGPTAQCALGQKQGAHASHGLHFLISPESDNAFGPRPTTEIDGRQWQFAVPTAAPANVGQRYANVVSAPSQTTVTPQSNALAVPDAPPVDPLIAGAVRAGAARIDSTWHVGASAGQYAGKTPLGFMDVHGEGVNPTQESAINEPSYGVEGREWARALAVEGADPDGSGPLTPQRLAVVSNDLYIPQALVNRRVASILEDRDRDIRLGVRQGHLTGIDDTNLTVSVSHSHSSPYYSTPAPGVWTFQDVFDVRYFEHIADRMADAVIAATAPSALKPVRMGAAEVPFTLIKRHSYGPSTSSERPGPLPAGFPDGDTIYRLAVVRFDDISDPAAPTPLGNWVVYGRHPEDLDGNDLLAGEYVNELETIVDREIGGVTVFSHSDLGTSEDASSARNHAPEQRQEFSHREYNQTYRAARSAADAVIDAHRVVASGPGPRTDVTHVPFRTEFQVGVKDLRFAPPPTRPAPSVSNCRTRGTFEGNLGVPAAGLPDCERAASPVRPPFDPGVVYDTLNEALPGAIPSTYSAPSYSILQESLQIHLQAIRLGDVGVTVCPCEQFADQARNIESRLDNITGNFWYGFDWTANPATPGWEPGVRYDGETDTAGVLLPGHGPLNGPATNPNPWCRENPDGTFSCRNPRYRPSPFLPPRGDQPEFLAPVPRAAIQKWKDQIYTDARGWEKDPAGAEGEEPKYGNFTHEEFDAEMFGGGYGLVLAVSMTNDYWGYIVPYREYLCCDHYRKALTSLGPHSSDFFATRLTRMAAELRGGDAVVPSLADTAYNIDSQNEEERARAIGTFADTYTPGYEQQLPPDAGTPGFVAQPTSVQRFGTSVARFIGGSNYFDSPRPRVQRCIQSGCDPTDPNAWEDYADGYSGVQVRVDYPDPEQVPQYRAGQYEWPWEVTFEAYDSDITLPDMQGVSRRQTPSGTYRVVIDGCKHVLPGAPGAGTCRSYDGRSAAYQITSKPFKVFPYTGLTVDEVQLQDGLMSFSTGPRYQALVKTGSAPATLQPIEIDASNMNRDRYHPGPEFYDYRTRDAVDYPDTYTSPFDVIGDELDRDLISYTASAPTSADDGGTGNTGNPPGGETFSETATVLVREKFCFHCSFMPWSDTGAVERVDVTIVRRNDTTEVVPTTFDPATQRWTSTVPIGPGDRAFVERGALVDSFGEFNGARSTEVSLPAPIDESPPPSESESPPASESESPPASESESPPASESESASPPPSPGTSASPSPRSSGSPPPGPGGSTSPPPSASPSTGPSGGPSGRPGDGTGVGGDGVDRQDEVARVAGADRIETALELSQRAFPTADQAILARADDFPDALASGTLGAEIDGPVLLTSPDGLDPRVAAELDRLGVSSVYLAGGTTALSPQVERDVVLGGMTFNRLDGESRFHTAAAVAREVAHLGGPVSQAIVARADSFADALAAGSLATTGRAPILLTTSTDLPAVTAEVLDEVVDGVRVFVAGGPEAVGAGPEGQLTAGGFTVERLAGGDRYATAVAVVREAVAQGADVEPTILASGRNWPDALAAIPAADRLGGIVLLVDPADMAASPATRDFLSGQAEPIDTVLIAGGTEAIAPLVQTQALDLIRDQ